MARPASPLRKGQNIFKLPPATRPIDFEAVAGRAWPAASWADRHVLVAVSGGSDSVALLRLLIAARETVAGEGRLVVAHYDHRVRGEASAADAAWVGALAVRLGVAIELGGSSQAGPRSEEALRAERHGFLLTTARRLGARYVATGHTLDDQAETVLFRVLRGTGVAGLRGIAPFRAAGDAVTLVRPLLALRRAALRSYLEALGQGWREDATNAARDAPRTWLRNSVLPAADELLQGGVREALARLAERAADAQGVVEAAANEMLARRSRHASGKTLRLDVGGLSELERIALREALRLAWRRAGIGEQAMTARHWRALEALAVADRGAPADFPGALRASREGADLVVTPC
ncbi:MAG: tRNA lysidine(34) synthetase TilS [Lacipirellulaceae bacterium]